MKDQRYRLSLVIPCYNESKNLLLLFDLCIKLPDDIEVVFVDNGSTDESPSIFSTEIPRHKNWQLVRVENNEGYGHGILSGLNAASADLLGWTHADIQTNPVDCLDALTFFEGGATNVFVKGKRYGRPLSDQLFTWGMSIFEMVILGRRLWDINAQPTIFSRQFYKQLKKPPKDFSLDLYFYYMAAKHEQIVRRFPVLFSERAHGESHWNINWREKWKFIKRTLNFSLELRNRKNKGILM